MRGGAGPPCNCHPICTGPGAAGLPEQLIAALEHLDRHPAVDVIVIARGGGTMEDLLPFSDEGLIRAVAACRTPVVSAIGHESNSPILDLVADYRASTPTDAAKQVVPDVADERGSSTAGPAADGSGRFAGGRTPTGAA